MATGDELVGFVRDSLARGLTREQIGEALRSAGWSGEQITRSLSAFATVDFPVPVPRPRPSLSARDAFLYLLMFTALYLAAFNLGSLIFQFIDRAFDNQLNAAAGPGLANRDFYLRGQIRWTMSYLLVSLPVFLLLARITGRAASRDPIRRISPIRRWLTYLTLFVSSCVLIGDLIGLINGFLSGDLPIQFLLKVLTVAAIAGTAFWYYLADLRADEAEAGVP